LSTGNNVFFKLCQKKHEAISVTSGVANYNLAEMNTLGADILDFQKIC